MLIAEWAETRGLKAGIPMPMGAFDAHWDAVGSGCQVGDVVNVIGTSTCIIALGQGTIARCRASAASVPGSVIPGLVGVEAGQSATGDHLRSDCAPRRQRCRHAVRGAGGV